MSDCVVFRVGTFEEAPIILDKEVLTPRDRNKEISFELFGNDKVYEGILIP